MTLRKKRSRIASVEDDARIALAELATRLDSMDNDYADLRGAVLGLGKRIDDLGSSINAKIDQRAQPQWQTYIAGAMLVGAMFFAFIAPIQNTNVEQWGAIKDQIAEHRQYVRDVNTELNRRNEIFVQQTEHREHRSRIDNALNGIRTRLDRAEAAIDREQERGRK